MTIATLSLGRRVIEVTIDDHAHTMPVGVDTLTDAELATDPPRPEELTNAIGLVADHLDDVVRLLPAIVGAAVHLTGDEVRAIAAVEVGGPPPLPFVLRREAAEDVFRTLATESHRQRALNPGLEASLVPTVVAGCCAVVAVMRRLQLDEVTVLS